MELLVNPPTHLEMSILGHRQIAAVEERVEIAPEQDAVVDAVRTELGIRTNVGRLEHGKNPFTRDCAAPPVRIGDEHPE